MEHGAELSGRDFSSHCGAEGAWWDEQTELVPRFIGEFPAKQLVALSLSSLSMSFYIAGPARLFPDSALVSSYVLHLASYGERVEIVFLSRESF